MTTLWVQEALPVGTCVLLSFRDMVSVAAAAFGSARPGSSSVIYCCTFFKCVTQLPQCVRRSVCLAGSCTCRQGGSSRKERQQSCCSEHGCHCLSVCGPFGFDVCCLWSQSGAVVCVLHECSCLLLLMPHSCCCFCWQPHWQLLRHFPVPLLYSTHLPLAHFLLERESCRVLSG